MPRNPAEADRKKNQFDKEERCHLLGIMKRYAPLLDKSASTLARKKIWTTIEEEFKNAGFTRKTSAQLKKYWQNYKYHCKRATAFGKESRRYADTSRPIEWNRYQVVVDDRAASKFPEAGDRRRTPASGRPAEEEDLRDAEPNGTFTAADVLVDLSRVKNERTAETPPSEDHGNFCFPANPQEDSLDEKKEILDRLPSPSILSADRGTKNRIVVSNARISNNSVTVSVLYPGGGQLSTTEASRCTPMRRIADAIWNDRTDASFGFDPTRTRVAGAATTSGCRDSAERNDPEECRSFGCSTNDESSRERPTRERSKEDGDFPATESEQNSWRGVFTRRDGVESRGYVFLTDYRSRLKHRLLQQRLETEEKRLKIRIAEMAIQEVQLRIRALGEDMRRTEELHRIRLAHLVTGSSDLRGLGGK